MAIKIVSGNLLKAEVDALVNTVNTVGVMGKGIALQCKRAFPGNFKAYKRACDAEEVQLGRMFVYDNGHFEHPNYIVNFPTKGHWRSKSRLSDIERGLEDLVRSVDHLGIKSIAVPPLGCGNGGLDWDDVRPLIFEALGGLSTVEVLLYPPAGAPPASQMPVRTERPQMTTGKAALISLIAKYRDLQDEYVGVSQIELQKLMYFQQVVGEPLRLQFKKARYGPYADNLNHVLNRIEGHFLRGFGDRCSKIEESDLLDLVAFAIEEADKRLAVEPETVNRIDRVLALVEGFESPYGLELLSTVHWLLDSGVKDEAKLVEAVHSWNARKERLFTERHIAIASEHLKSQEVDQLSSNNNKPEVAYS